MENNSIQKLLDCNPEPVLIVEKKTGSILSCNKVFRNEYGFSEEKIKNIFDITVHSDRESLLHILNCRNTEEEIHLKLRNGRIPKYRISSTEFDDDKVLCSLRQYSGQLANSCYELFNKLNDAVITTDFNQNIMTWNKTAVHIYGWSEEEAVGKNLDGLLFTEMTEAEKSLSLFELEKNGSSQLKVTQRHKNGQPVFIESHTFVINDGRGKISGYVSVNKDISIRVETLKQLRRSEERYKQLFDENPLPIVIYKQDDYSILDINYAAVKKFQYTAEQLLKFKVLNFIMPEDKDNFIRITSLTNQADKRESRLRSKNKSGEILFIEYSSTQIKYKEFDARMVVINDITEKQKTEEKLYESSAKLNTIVDNLPIVLLELDEKGKFILHEGKALKDAGFKTADMTIKSAYKTIGDIMITRHNGDYISINEIVPRVMKGEMIVGHTTIADRYFDNYFVPVKKEEEKITGIIGVFLDITERVNLEKSNYLSEEKFRLIAENTSELISMVSENKYLYLSPSFEKELGYSQEELQKLGPYSIIHPDDKPILKNRRDKGMLEFRVTTKDGEWLWLEGESFSLPGDPKIIVGIAKEITNRKIAQQALKDSEERYRLLFEKNPVPMFVYDEETLNFLAVNAAIIKHYGYSRDEFLGMNIKNIRPDEDIPVLMDVISNPVLGKTRYGTWRHMKKNGDIMDVDITIHQITFNKRPARIVLANDLTEKVKAEKALIQSEEKYRRIVENANEGIWLFDDNWCTTFVNSKLANILGYNVKEMENRSIIEFLNDDDIKKAETYLQKIRKGSKENIKLRLKHKDGIEVWVVSNAVPILSDKNVFTGSLALVTDITSQKKAEEILQRTNEMLNALINSSPLSIIILDKNGKIELWNPASEKMFGWKSDEVLGKKLPTASGEKNQEQNDLINLVNHGNSFTGKEVVRTTKDGGKINVSISASPMFDSNKKTIGSASFLMDITEKKLAEKEREKLFKEINNGRKRLKLLSARLIEVQENEKRNIARELHDEIGQILTAIKIDLQRIKQESISDESNLLIDDCTSLVEKTISIVRNLSHELRPSIIDDLGLTAALRWYIDKFSQRTGIKVNKQISKIDKFLPPEGVITLFRVCQEALTNIAKHSQADYVTVSLNKEKNIVNLLIEDNGKGFEAKKALRLAAKGEGLGLLNMQERVELINGKLKIVSSKNSGTKIKVMCQT